MIIGVDASNISRGGGLTHLIEFFNSSLKQNNEEKFVIWGDSITLCKLPKGRKIKKISNSIIPKPIFFRFLWQHFFLSKELEKENCDILLCPSGVYTGKFRKFVCICQNLLPFEKIERSRFKYTKDYFRYILLNFLMNYSFQRSVGIIFLSEYARKIVLKNKKLTKIKNKIIPHGIADRFLKKKSKSHIIKSIYEYTYDKPLRLSYVSIINFYKHQDKVLKAVYKIRKKYKWHIQITFAGPSNKIALKNFTKLKNFFDPNQNWIKYLGNVDYNMIDSVYKNTDIGIFASSCENLPIIMLEYLGSKIPMAVSSRGPMPDIAKNAAVYFDPEDPSSIYDSLKKILIDKKLQKKLTMSSQEIVKEYNWIKTTKNTINFLRELSI